MNLENGLKTSELSPLQTHLDPVRTRDVNEKEAAIPAPLVSGGSDDFHVTENYVERLLGEA